MVLIDIKAANSEDLKQFQIDAVLIYKVTKYIRWQHKGDINICIFGQDSDEGDKIGLALKQISESKNTLEHSAKVISNVALFKIKDCHVLYIPESEIKNLSEVVAQTSKKSIVTISNISFFLNQGGIFRLAHNENGKTSLIINYKNALKNNINVDASLLEIIKVIE